MKANNVAALREALEHVEKLAREFAVGNYYVCDFSKMLLDVTRAGLAASARNCDMFSTAAQAIDAFYGWGGETSAACGRDFVNWLFAPVKKEGAK